MNVCVPVTETDQVDPRWGRADWVAVATIRDGVIAQWQRFEVSWSTHHDEGSPARHHARIARFLKEHHVDVVVANHVGDGMIRMVSTMGITLALEAAGDARAEVLRLTAS